MSTQREKSSQALYEIIENDIIEKIQKGEFHKGDRLPSEAELVASYQVSRITAAKALDELALNGYIYRVQGKGSFANELGDQLRIDASSKRSAAEDGPRKIALIIPEHSDYHSGSIIRAVTDLLTYPHYFVSVILNRQAGIEEYALSHLLSCGYSGAILFPCDCEFYSDIILQLHLSKFPLILIDRNFPGISCDCVVSDNQKGVALGMEYLFSLGHSKIAFASDSSYREQISSARYTSYMECMVRRQLPPIAYESFFHGDESEGKRQDFLDKVQKRQITAVFASNSHVASRLMELCSSNNIVLPQELSLICFDSPAVSLGTNDYLTYIDQDSYAMGREAANLIDSALNGTSTGVRRIVTTPKLVIHRSAVPVSAALRDVQ